MKKIALAVALALGTVAQPVALAGTSTGTLSVSATVVASCTSVSAAPLNFGSIAATSGGTAEATITVNCGQGVAYTVDLDNGLAAAGGPRLLRNGTSTFPYILYSDAARTTIWGITGTAAGATVVSATMGASGSASHTVYGLALSVPDTAPGLYTDTVTVTLTY